MYFVSCEDDIKLKALLSLGFLCLGHPDFLMRENIIQLYRRILTERTCDVRQKVQVLRNVENFLKEDESKMVQGYECWEKTKDDANLKEMGETLSGLSSSVIQCYIREVLECYFHEHAAVRSVVSEVVSLTMQQGLIHPVQVVHFCFLLLLSVAPY
ncbi:unnamed protein product [Soboliphyme baturini]|uniref:Nipped-B protein n=1 Tax=Soboliphyme baturini TaxID=241478 RepID=A0A183INE4_9BILA|nr:unnamed protein product [Soboliphyme baturini]